MLKNPSRNFSVDQIAAAHRISPRYVQKLFEEDGTTFTEFVLNARLALAHRLLSDPTNGNLVSAVALEVGFNDVSYATAAPASNTAVHCRTCAQGKARLRIRPRPGR